MKRSSSSSPAYLDTPEAAERFLDSISETRVLAIDTEGASFHRFVDRIYLLQLSTQDAHAIVDPLRVPNPSGLGRLLESREVEVVFHDADYDLRLLRQDYGWQVTNIFDTRIAAQLLGIKSFGLAALLEQYFQIKLDKKHQRADWSMRPLTDDMLEYAAQDTLHLLNLRLQLREQLERKGRWHWATEEFARLEAIRWESEDPGSAFLRVKGARDLNRRELALLRELVQWRDGVAQSLDRSSFRVVGNEVLLELSRKPPSTVQHLRGVKGLSPRLAESQGEVILAAIRRGQSVADADLPRFPRAPRWDRDPSFEDRVAKLKSERDAAAQRLDMDPGVLCGRERLEAVARKNPSNLDELATVSELRKWQIEALGEGFVRVLRKRAQPSSGTDSPYREDA